MMDLTTDGLWKIFREEDNRFRYLRELANYSVIDGDVRLHYAATLTYNGEDFFLRNWIDRSKLKNALRSEFNLVDIFQVFEMDLYDGGYMGRQFVVARFTNRDMALLFKLMHG